MNTYSLRLALLVATTITPGIAWAQHDADQAGAPQASSAELTPCVREQPVTENIITAATARAEAARLSNSPTDMRAALDHLEAALRDIRAQSALCAAAVASTDPHAGHTMPNPTLPGSTPPPQAPTRAVDPHAGHTMPSAAPGSKETTTANPHAGGEQRADADASGIETWLKGYDAAFNAKDLERLAAFYHPDVTIYEGGGINNGWADYRDRHLGPELKTFENLQFGHSNIKVSVLPGGQSAYATSEYFIKAKMGERDLDSRGLETLVLIKGADGTWRIRHSHTSSRPARRPAG
jgi:ketosteroid isomerase-like protein